MRLKYDKARKLIVSAYTGILMVEFTELHKFFEEKLGRPIFTHELANEELVEQLKNLLKMNL